MSDNLKQKEYNYCNSLTSYSRFVTRVINIGNTPLGGDYPIRLQSMTSTNTMDTKATVEQSIRMINAGCEYIRIAAPGIKEANNLVVIKSELKKKGYDIPIIADVHFNPKVAELAAGIVEKVRINPGNYADKKRLGKIEYTNKEYCDELERIRIRLFPLIKVCKEYGTVIRIGTNHGSLSNRIMSRYGDTPLGMVESAMEFIRICESSGFGDIVLSMKSSNIRVMVQAYRLLINRMKTEGMNYPLHLGVTEAGNAEDGRIKSAAGIGTLLEDGIGDTIRVSLTEDPENEIPVAKTLVKRYTNRKGHKPIKPVKTVIVNPFEYNKRETIKVGNIGGDELPVVISEIETINIKEYLVSPNKTQNIKIVRLSAEDASKKNLEKVSNDKQVIIVLETNNLHGMAEQRSLFFALIKKKCKVPVIILREYKGLSVEEFLLFSSVDLSGLLLDGFGDGIWLKTDNIDPKVVSQTAYGILQATGRRITTTEFISCPTCGRTMFNVQETLENIKKRTNHLKGLKIGVMGCFVNGPGEMADADYGYVGAGKGKVMLYKGKQVIEKSVDEEKAVETLIKLIKKSGDWVDNPV